MIFIIMTSETPIKQILQNQGESAYNYRSFFTDTISPTMICPWNDSVRKNKITSNLKQNDKKRISDFRQASKINSSAYQSIMQVQVGTNLNQHDIDDMNESYLLSSTINNKSKAQIRHKLQTKTKGQNCNSKLKKSYTEEDCFQKYKCKWNEWQLYQNQKDEQKTSKMFQTLSTLNKKQINIINHSLQKTHTQKTNLNRKKLQTSIIDINQNADFNFSVQNRIKNEKQFFLKTVQTVKAFYKLNRKVQTPQKNNKNKHKRHFNKFYFDFSVFGFKKDNDSLHKLNQQINKNRHKQNQTKDSYFQYSLNLKKKDQSLTKNMIKIRQLPRKLKSNKKIQMSLINGNQQRRKCKTQGIRPINVLNLLQQIPQGCDQKNQGSIVINLNKMLNRQVRPMPALNKLTQSSVYRKLRKTLCL